MNLPLQMRAVSRGSFSRSRIANSGGEVFPSLERFCLPPNVACSCPNGIICCPDPNGQTPCTCDGSGNPMCGGFGGHGLGTKHHHIEVDCWNQSSEQSPYNPVDCN